MKNFPDKNIWSKHIFFTLYYGTFEFKFTKDIKIYKYKNEFYISVETWFVKPQEKILCNVTGKIDNYITK